MSELDDLATAVKAANRRVKRRSADSSELIAIAFLSVLAIGFAIAIVNRPTPVNTITTREENTEVVRYGVRASDTSSDAGQMRALSTADDTIPNSYDAYRPRGQDISPGLDDSGGVHVNGYYRRDGTFVHGYTRRRPSASH